ARPAARGRRAPQRVALPAGDAHGHAGPARDCVRLMYMLERDAQPTVFTSIPKTMWWGIVTIASVGYGDMTPVTPLGRISGGIVIMLGIAVFAVPAGILATGFAAELRKRDFVVPWDAVAKVPLFANLDARQIADIARLLKPQLAPPRYLIV